MIAKPALDATACLANDPRVPLAMDDDEREQALAAIRRVAQGEGGGDGRDEVARGPRIVLGGTRGRALELAIVERNESDTSRRFVMSGGEATITVTLAAKGEWMFAYGDLQLEV